MLLRQLSWAGGLRIGPKLMARLLLCDPQGRMGILRTAMTRVLVLESFPLANADAVVARARSGDPEALEQIFRAFQTPVYNLARRICRTVEDAEDVLQETFLEVAKSIKRFRGEGSLWAWVRTIASSKALMRLRRNKYRDADELHDEVFPTRREDRHLRMDLEAALERLPEMSRAVVWLHDVEGYTHSEIGAMMGKSVSFSKSQLARAHVRLRGWLGEEASV
jgi:RNA polymerase sigma factor (sigma-70 family)